LTSLRARILTALDHQFRSAAEVAERAGMDKTSVAPALGHLRQAGMVECQLDGGASLWRRPLPG
jgi:DNA-binding IclR family transcriptional regulator